MNSNTLEHLAWARLSSSAMVLEQQVAFTCATGVPLALVPASIGAPPDNHALCVKGCLGEPSGKLCRQQLLQAEKRAVTRIGPVQYCCPSGLVKILVPVFINGQHVGSLLAGAFALHSLDGEMLKQLAGRLDKLGLGDRIEKLQTMWSYSPLLSSDKCRAAGTLLRMFAKYLEESGRQELQSVEPRRSALLEKIEAFLAEAFLANCQSDHVSLKEIASRVNLSPCHFCSVFKKQTGVTFSQYCANQRLDKARDLLSDGERRVSDVAFESGFESIPYFNRAFRKRFGCSPSEFRARLRARNPGQANRKAGVAENVGEGFND